MKAVQQTGHVRQVDFPANVQVPEHDEALAQLETGRFVGQRVEVGHGRAAGARVVVHRSRAHQIRARSRPAPVVVLQDLQQQVGVDLRRVFHHQLAERSPDLRLETLQIDGRFKPNCTRDRYVFEAFLEPLGGNISKDHVVLVDLPKKDRARHNKRLGEVRLMGVEPNVAVLVGEDAQKEFALAVSDARLRDDHVVAGGQREERHHFPGHRVVRHVQRFLRIKWKTIKKHARDKKNKPGVNTRQMAVVRRKHRGE